MKRRALLAALIAAPVIATSSAMAPTSNPVPEIRHIPKGDYVLLEGNPEHLKKFLTRYQDALWPEWRGNDFVERRYRAACEHIDKTKSVSVWTTGPITKNAYLEASR